MKNIVYGNMSANRRVPRTQYAYRQITKTARVCIAGPLHDSLNLEKIKNLPYNIHINLIFAVDCGTVL